MMQSVAVSIKMIYDDNITELLFDIFQICVTTIYSALIGNHPIIVLRSMSPQEFSIVPSCHLVSRAPVMRPILLSLIVVTDFAFLILSNAASVDQGAHHMLHTVMVVVYMEAGHVSSIPAPGLLTGRMEGFLVPSLQWRLGRETVLSPALTFLQTVVLLHVRPAS